MRDRINALLSADVDELTAGDLASRATWADKYRDSDRNSTKQRYEATRQWHFVDIGFDSPNIDAACFDHPPVPPSTPASMGPKDDCVVDKINQFREELANPATSESERSVPFKFILHFVGDVHQPLHSADDHDRGGNDKFVLFGRRTVCTALHSYWDTNLVQRLGRDYHRVAVELATEFASKRATWMDGQPADWAREAFGTAKDIAYNLPATVPDERGHQCSELTAQYDDAAIPISPAVSTARFRETEASAAAKGRTRRGFPARDVGRTLSRAEAVALLERIDRRQRWLLGPTQSSDCPSVLTRNWPSAMGKPTSQANSARLSGWPPAAS